MSLTLGGPDIVTPAAYIVVIHFHRSVLLTVERKLCRLTTAIGAPRSRKQTSHAPPAPRPKQQYCKALSITMGPLVFFTVGIGRLLHFAPTSGVKRRGTLRVDGALEGARR